MNNKSSTIIFYAGVIFLSLWFGASGFLELTHNSAVWDITTLLGYPGHFIYILGVAKLSGIIVLLIPNRLLRLKEWVFAGIFFDIMFAFLSKIAVLGLPSTIDAILAFIIAVTTYIQFRKRYHVSYKKLKQG